MGDITTGQRWYDGTKSSQLKSWLRFSAIADLHREIKTSSWSCDLSVEPGASFIKKRSKQSSFMYDKSKVTSTVSWQMWYPSRWCWTLGHLHPRLWPYEECEGNQWPKPFQPHLSPWVFFCDADTHNVCLSTRSLVFWIKWGAWLEDQCYQFRWIWDLYITGALVTNGTI